ncbi:hypothetical protein LWI28_028162 [Acer negundo]|uniref:Uncharacterized protein ycf68 n=1 Tax=Acer negundo TaxID=4023 RepID=A0AAD5P0K0_ACENE|nr:hypothetical protein LWI28_028162 [Acer negundo]
MCSSAPDPEMWIIQGTLAWRTSPRGFETKLLLRRIDGAIQVRSNVDPTFYSLVGSGRSGGDYHGSSLLDPRLNWSLLPFLISVSSSKSDSFSLPHDMSIGSYSKKAYNYLSELGSRSEKGSNLTSYTKKRKDHPISNDEGGSLRLQRSSLHSKVVSGFTNIVDSPLSVSREDKYGTGEKGNSASTTGFSIAMEATLFIPRGFGAFLTQLLLQKPSLGCTMITGFPMK